VHLPVQSGSDRVLAAMKRGYTSLEYRSIVRRLRKARPASLSSDFIVGFPGETRPTSRPRSRSRASCDFDGSYSFLYSPRPGTPARDCEDPCPWREARAAAAAAGAARAQAQQSARPWSGRCSARWSKARRRAMPASSPRAPQQPHVNFAGRADSCTLRDLRITEARHHSLRGETG
jgi:tRNA-2-methylthio-N6-dimethylallyladenosine synthase